MNVHRHNCIMCAMSLVWPLKGRSGMPWYACMRMRTHHDTSVKQLASHRGSSSIAGKHTQSAR